mmetsp:Transcript_51916/g.157702  ORF Transcript_51916/g.157702 Transcript_51916/m.157702 type:complete len:263 (-) Transcript_51916:320-1108(-)
MAAANFKDTMSLTSVVFNIKVTLLSKCCRLTCIRFARSSLAFALAAKAPATIPDSHCSEKDMNFAGFMCPPSFLAFTAASAWCCFWTKALEYASAFASSCCLLLWVTSWHRRCRVSLCSPRRHLRCFGDQRDRASGWVFRNTMAWLVGETGGKSCSKLRHKGGGSGSTRRLILYASNFSARWSRSSSACSRREARSSALPTMVPRLLLTCRGSKASMPFLRLATFRSMSPATCKKPCSSMDAPTPMLTELLACFKSVGRSSL